MRKPETKSLPDKNGVVAEALSGEYTLIKPIIYFGLEVTPPTKVLLDDQQAERLRKTGHIE